MTETREDNRRGQREQFDRMSHHDKFRTVMMVLRSFDIDAHGAVDREFALHLMKGLPAHHFNSDLKQDWWNNHSAPLVASRLINEGPHPVDLIAGLTTDVMEHVKNTRDKPAITKAVSDGDMKVYVEYADGARIWLGHTRPLWDGRMISPSGELWMLTSNFNDPAEVYNPIAVRVDDMPATQNYSVDVEAADQISIPWSVGDEDKGHLPAWRPSHRIPIGEFAEMTTADLAEWELIWGSCDFPTGRYPAVDLVELVDERAPTKAQIAERVKVWDDADRAAEAELTTMRQNIAAMASSGYKQSMLEIELEKMGSDAVRWLRDIIDEAAK